MPTFKYDNADNKTFTPDTRKAICDHIKELIEQWSIKQYPSEFRDHLGSSIIGDKCSRKIWYNFRWVMLPNHDGRIRRLFERGKKEEKDFIKILKGIGFQVWELDPTTDKQFKISGYKKHYGGSLDATGLMPWFPDLPVLFEFKTHNTKSFCELVSKGLLFSKPQHYAQMCAYGKHYEMKYGLYLAINKNDDDIYPELVELNYNYADSLEKKAEDIINSQQPPPRISNNPNYFECKYCDFVDVCHHRVIVSLNCRSCRYAQATDNAEWFCNLYEQLIPSEYIKNGCSNHVSINE
jgi:hypothetical protein